MTEQEANAFAKRLTRIWKLSEPFAVELWTSQGLDAGIAWHLHAQLDSLNTLDVYVSGLPGDSPVLRLDEHRADDLCPHTIIWEDADRIYMSHDDAHIAASWYPLFRRNCWLSGANIEASAHEKAEWLQGFTREVIECGS